MVQENEIIMCVLSLGVLAFIIFNRHELKHAPSAKVLIAAFFIFTLGWIFTVLETFFLNTILNFLEHLSYAAGSVCIAFWCWQALGKVKGNK